MSLAVVFIASLWVCAAALLLSAASKARGMSAALVAGGALLFVLFVGGTRMVPALLFALTGAGGQLAELADVAIQVPSKDTQHIQEAHLAVEHLICWFVERDLFASPAAVKGREASV